MKRAIHTTEKTAEALTLRAAGMTYDQIACQVGYKTRSAAYKAVQRELARTVMTAAGELRKMQQFTLDQMVQRLWPLVFDQPKPNLRAVDRLLKVLHQEALLNGLYPKPGQAAHGVVDHKARTIVMLVERE